jgi:hypothetical protein
MGGKREEIGPQVRPHVMGYTCGTATNLWRSGSNSASLPSTRGTVVSRYVKQSDLACCRKEVGKGDGSGRLTLKNDGLKVGETTPIAWGKYADARASGFATTRSNGGSPGSITRIGGSYRHHVDNQRLQNAVP